MRVRFQVGASGAHRPVAGHKPATAAVPGWPSHGALLRAAPKSNVQPPRRTPPKAAAKGKTSFRQGAVAAAILIAAAGCASLEPIQTRVWKVVPVLDVKHAVQSSHDYYQLGRYHDGAQAWDRSIDAYRKAIVLDPRNVEARNALGVALARRQRYDEAETVLRTALSIDPNAAHVWSNLGYVLLLAGKPRHAVVELKTALKLDRANAIALHNLRVAMAHLETTADDAPQREGPAVVSVPAPITTIEVPAPLDTRISVPAPFVAAGVPAPAAMRVIDQPTVDTQMAGAPAQPRTPARVDASSGQLELSNGNGVTGAAARLRKWLSTQGMRTTRLTNQRPYVQQHTVIQYRSGQEAAAQRVARTLRMTVQPDPMPSEQLRTDVRVVLGHDWARTAACLEHSSCAAPEKVAVALPDPR